MTLSRVIEALLFSAQKPLSIREITTAIKSAEGDDSPNEFARVREAEVAAAIEQLRTEYVEQGGVFQLIEKAEGWQLATDPKYAPWVRQLFPAPKPARLSAPALETLAIIAYRQPITRADVEAVRGVNIDGVLQTLMERGGSGSRREHRWRAANIDGARSRQNCRTRRNPGATASV